MTDIDISIIIVNWNTRELLLQCLESIPQGFTRATYEVLLVDNASIDGSVEAVRSRFPGVVLLANVKNAGFAAANNQAAQRALGRYLFFLNPDTIVLPGSIEALLGYADQHSETGILGPKILNPDGSRQLSCWREYPGVKNALVDAFYLWKLPWLWFSQASVYTDGELSETREVAHLLGACLFIRRETWEQIGPFDEQFFIFLEETDLCFLAKQNHWKVEYFPGSEIIHYGRQSVIQRPSANYPHLYRSYCHFWRKHHPEKQGKLMAIKLIIALASLIRVTLWFLRSLSSRSSEQRKRANSLSKGYWKVFREVWSY